MRVYRLIVDKTQGCSCCDDHFRKTNKNIGVDWPLVSVELKILLDDVQYQAENNIYPKDELAARFHHRLVAIHPFPNGNGRHARMMADIMLIALGCNRFSWGSNSLAESSPVRKLYIEALREADRMNYEKLINFKNRAITLPCALTNSSFIYELISFISSLSI